mmetsp:Transcript_98082/g.299854  ORF Transcript_98082/g.299854 Transcript_98082/m.299854 type:complete len:230 (+) Transcript_98082:8394-9083(+)
MQIVSFCRMMSSLGLKYIRISCNHSKSLAVATLCLTSVRETSRWCTTSVIICASFWRLSLEMSWMTVCAMNSSCSKQRVTTLSISPNPPALRATSVFWHQSAVMAFNIIWHGYLGTHAMNLSATTFPASVNTCSMSTMALFRCSPSESCIIFSVLDSHPLIDGSSAILIGLIKSTISPSLELMLISTSLLSLDVPREAMPANILPRCRLTQPASRELPIISRRSSSPTK